MLSKLATFPYIHWVDTVPEFTTYNTNAGCIWNSFSVTSQHIISSLHPDELSIHSVSQELQLTFNQKYHFVADWHWRAWDLCSSIFHSSPGPGVSSVHNNGMGGYQFQVHWRWIQVRMFIGHSTELVELAITGLLLIHSTYWATLVFVSWGIFKLTLVNALIDFFGLWWFN